MAASYIICSVVPLPPQRNRPVVEEDCPKDSLKIGFVRSKVWPVGYTLKIYLIGGSDLVREKVEKYAREWTKYANIRMDFVSSIDQAEIRVSFKKGGSWSVVGRDCLEWRDCPTMNFGWFDDRTPDRELARTVYHEFGHALGLVHEHQRPEGGIKWNVELVKEYFSSVMGWDEATIIKNILQKYDKTTTQFSRFDRKSIMLYHFPRELTLNGSFVDPNDVLSSSDKKFIGKLYPKEVSRNVPTLFRRLTGQRSRQARKARSRPLRRSPRLAQQRKDITGSLSKDRRAHQRAPRLTP